MHTVVEVLYGSHVRRWAGRSLELTSLRLWGPFKDVWIHFEWDVLTTGTMRKRITRILVFALHPQKMLSYQARSVESAIQQDKHITVAYRLAGVSVTEDYHQKMAWTSKRDFIRTVYTKGWDEIVEDAASEADLITLRDYGAQKQAQNKELALSRAPRGAVMSLARLDVILSQVLESGGELGRKDFNEYYASIHLGNDLTCDPLSPLLKEWLESQQMTLFNGQSVQSLEHLLPAYMEHCLERDEDMPGKVDVMELILALMNMQQARMRNRSYPVRKTNAAN
jgi:hypothetical protein